MTRLNSMIHAKPVTLTLALPPLFPDLAAPQLEHNWPPIEWYDRTPLPQSGDTPMVAIIITNLMEWTHEWATVESERWSSICDSVAWFSAALSCVFGQPVSGQEAGCALAQLRQESSHVFSNPTKFHTLAAESSWNDETLPWTLHHSLCKQIKDRLSTVNLPLRFEALVELATKICNQLQE